MNLLAALESASTKAKPESRTNSGHARSREVLRERADARWKRAFGEQPRTTSYLAAKQGFSHMGALSSLYRLEKRELVQRAGLEPTLGNRPVILWEWIGE